MHDLGFLDVNCGVGPYYNPPDGHDWSAAGLLAKMDELGIAEACPSAVMGRDYDPWQSNLWLMENVAPSERLHPVWTAANHHSGEFPAPAELIERMRRQGVKMLRLYLYPEAFVDRLDLPIFGELFDALAEYRVPLLLDCAGPAAPRAQDLEPVLRQWPSLPFILSVPKIVQHDRWFYYLWERYDNFQVDLPGYQSFAGTEAVVRRFGSRPLVFGSRYPYFTPMQSMLQLAYAEIEESDKRSIAGNNMRRLLGEVRL